MAREGGIFFFRVEAKGLEARRAPFFFHSAILVEFSISSSIPLRNPRHARVTSKHHDSPSTSSSSISPPLVHSTPLHSTPHLHLHLHNYQHITCKQVYKPTSPGQRGRITTLRDHLWKGKPYKPLTIGLRKTGKGGLGEREAGKKGGGEGGKWWARVR